MIALIALQAYSSPHGGTVASLTIRGLDEAIKGRLRLEAAHQGISMEEAARRILARALLGRGPRNGGLGARIHGYFVEADAYDLAVPARSSHRPPPVFANDKT
jgi:plasmid stability protein